MKKNQNNKTSPLVLFLLGMMTLIAIGCDGKEDANIPSSTVTYLPNIILNGDSSVMLDCSTTSYSDEGAIATEGGAEIALSTAISGLYYGSTSIDGVDIYSVSYSAENVDGIPGAAFRDITWPACSGDFVTSIAGMYKATVAREGVIDDDYVDMYPVIIKDLGNDTYALSHAMGGYYDYGRGYGPDYACLGAIITADITADSFSVSQAQFPVWGNTGDISGFTIDSVTKTITYTSLGNFGNGTFDVTLTLVE